VNLKTALARLAVAALFVSAAGCSSASEGQSADPVATSTSTSPAATKSSPSATPSSAAPAQAAAVITIKDFKFSGPDSVAPGAQVMVKNADSTNHTVTADGDGGFDVTINAGSTGTFTAPSQPGNYPYVCTFHGDMTGTLVVK